MLTILNRFRNIRWYCLSKQKTGETRRQTILTLHLEGEPKKCKPGRTGRTTRRPTRKCSNWGEIQRVSDLRHCSSEFFHHFRRDLSRAVKLLEMVKRREKTKREELQLSIEIYEKRYQAKDFSGQLMAEYTSAATKLRYSLINPFLTLQLTILVLFRPAFAPLYSNQYHHQHLSSLASQHNQWNSSSQNYSNLHINHHLQNNKRDFDGLSTSSSRKEKRQYKKRKHKAPREVKPSKSEHSLVRRKQTNESNDSVLLSVEPYDGMFSSDDEDVHNNQMVASESEDEGIYPFRRNRNCDYYKVSCNHSILRRDELLNYSLSTVILATRWRLR